MLACVAHGTLQTPRCHKYLFHHGTKVCVPAYKKLIPNVCSQEVTACFMFASVANQFSATCLFTSPKRCISLDPYCQLDLWLVTSWWVGANEHFPIQCWSSTQWFPCVYIPSELPGWQAVCGIFWHEASCHFLVSDTWHHFFYTRIQSLVPWWDQCLNVNGHDVKVLCVPSATYVPCVQCTQNKGSASECLTPSRALQFVSFIFTFIYLFLKIIYVILWCSFNCRWYLWLSEIWVLQCVMII
jgi:hypothetical protein